MRRIIGWRTLRLSVTMSLVLVIAFVALRFSGTPIQTLFPEGIDTASAARLASQWGLDQPIYIQFAVYLGHVVHLDFGTSLLTHRAVIDTYRDVLPRTLLLGSLATVLSVVVSLPLGAGWAFRGGGRFYTAIGLIGFVLYAVPNFVIAILFIYVFGFWLGWLPTMGSSTPAHYILPVAVLALSSIAVLSRYVRSAVSDQMGEDHIRTAIAKGLSRRQVEWRHGLRNALIPIVTIVGMDIQHIVTGSMIIETVFSWRGVGGIFIGAIGDRDYPLVQFGVLFYATIVVLTNYLVDVCYVCLDPRIRIDA